jgi:glycosyltransferase involved in cell wall biosynthesis
MKILYLCADFGIPIRGYKGASVHVREMVAALRSRGHEVVVASPNLGEGNGVADGTDLHAVELDRLSEGAWKLGRMLRRQSGSRLPNELREAAYNGTLLRAGSALVRKVRPDAIYERYSLLNLAGLLLARFWGLPHVLEVNAPLRLERARTKGLALGGVAAVAERVLFGRTDVILTVSGALRRYVIERGAQPERTLVQPNGVDTRRFRPDRDGSRARARLGIPAEAVVAGFSGSLKPWHGTDVLVEAFGALRARHPAARLLVIGEGPQADALRRQVARLRIEPAVLFTGRVDHENIPELLCAMDIAVAPYRQVPGFYFSPLKIYEYMASGRAVVASAAGEIPDLVRPEETGLLCAPDDAGSLAAALSRLCESAALRQKLGDAARREALHHDWLEHASRVTRLIEQVRRQGNGSSAPGVVMAGRGSPS